MKILITTDLYTTDTNGVVTSVRNLTQALQKKGHEVRILTLSERLRSYRRDNIYFIRSLPLDIVYPDVRMPTAYRHRYIRELVRWKPDVIHSQCEYFSYQFAQHISKKTHAPIVHTYHTLYEQYATYVIPSQRLGTFLVGKLSKLRLRKADAIVAPTQKVETVLRGYGIHNPIHVVPSGIALEQHKERISPEERQARRKALGIPEDHTVLLNLGRLGTEKNLSELIELFSLALRQNPKLTFLVVGDGPARQDLEALSQKLGIRDRVIFTGMVDPTEVHKYYQLGDLFVSASTSETQGLTYVEALAAGTPALCRADECLEGVILEGENGWQYRTEEEFRQRVEEFFAAPEKKEAMSAAARAVAEEYSAERFGQRAEAIYAARIQKQGKVVISA